MKAFFVLILIVVQVSQLFGEDLFNLDLSVAKTHELIGKGWECSDIVRHFIRRASLYNSKINAIISYNPNAIPEAIELDKYYAEKGKLIGKLHCVAVLLKDNIDMKGISSTAGVAALRYSIPNTNAALVDKLKAEGAIIIAKANMAKLAIGRFYKSDNGGECKNPFDVTRTCGASSSGSAAGMAAAFSIIGIGSDTDGSIIYPASYCGLFGLRPPQDKVSLDGVIPVFDRQDTVGPLTKNMNDLVLSYSIMSGNTSIYDYYLNGTAPAKLRVGYITNFFDNFNISISLGTYSYSLDTVIKSALYDAISKFKKLNNVEVIEKSIVTSDFNELLTKVKQVVEFRYSKLQSACYKASINAYLNSSIRFESDAPYHSFEDFFNSKLLTSDVKSFLNDSHLSDSQDCSASAITDYDKYKTELKNAVIKWFDESNLDALVFASAPGLPGKLATSDNRFGGDAFASASGLAALNIPYGYSEPTNESSQGLPIGILLMSKEETLANMFKIAKLYETSYVKTVLPLLTPPIDNDCIEPNPPGSSSSHINFNYLLFLIAFVLFKYHF